MKKKDYPSDNKDVLDNKKIKRNQRVKSFETA